MKTFAKVGATAGNPFFGTGETAECREGCGACCIAPSISTLDKPAGVPCRHLTPELRCVLFGEPERPACCGGLQPSTEMCGESREQALTWLAALERATS